VCGRASVAGFGPDSGGFDPVSGFAFFVEVAQYQKSNIRNQNDKSKSKNQTNPSIKIQMAIEILKPKH
jgi:hypothetical protein